MNWFSNSKKKELTPVEASLREAKGPVLRILLGKEQIATLFHDGSTYCLAYTDNFRSSGLVAFHATDTKKFEMPEIDKLYRSTDLWPVFESRLPSPDRDDYSMLMRSKSLSGKEHPLEILGKIGAISISKPWRLEIVSSSKKVS